jgi:phosphatidylethanolamine-binding protein (PEBP) family uncharacterized protein
MANSYFKVHLICVCLYHLLFVDAGGRAQYNHLRSRALDIYDNTFNDGNKCSYYVNTFLTSVYVTVKCSPAPKDVKIVLGTTETTDQLAKLSPTFSVSNLVPNTGYDLYGKYEGKMYGPFGVTTKTSTVVTTTPTVVPTKETPIELSFGETGVTSVATLILNAKYTCSVTSPVSPPMTWSNFPDSTKSFVLLMSTQESGSSEYNFNWVYYGLTREGTSLSYNLASGQGSATGSTSATQQGIFGCATKYNELDICHKVYWPPCSSGPYWHQYTFTVYALKEDLITTDSVTGQDLKASLDMQIGVEDGIVAGAASVTVKSCHYSC